MKKYRFYKDELGWFIDLKWFPFSKGHLAMIAGADSLLDILSDGKPEVTLKVSTKPIPFYDGILKKQFSSLTLGGIYITSKGYEEKHDVESIKSVWLCPVTLLLFFKYPKQIYFKII